MADFVCEGCRKNVALLRGSDGKQLCTSCVEAARDLEGVEPESLRMIKVIAALGSDGAGGGGKRGE